MQEGRQTDKETEKALRNYAGRQTERHYEPRHAVRE
jgi:hypothetical protein